MDVYDKRSMSLTIGDNTNQLTFHPGVNQLAETDHIAISIQQFQRNLIVALFCTLQLSYCSEEQDECGQFQRAMPHVCCLTRRNPLWQSRLNMGLTCFCHGYLSGSRLQVMSYPPGYWENNARVFHLKIAMKSGDRLAPWASCRDTFGTALCS